MLKDRGWRAADIFAAVLAIALLTATLAWHFPFMLHDHLDLAPIYNAWRNGEITHSGFLKIHGGHLHTAAYVVLLGAAWATDGHPWLDCTVSWLLLIGYAMTMRMICRQTLVVNDCESRLMALLMVFLVLYPGHLANLQWGWQVAVFLCVFGVVVAIRALTAVPLNWQHNVLAMAATLLSLLSFATALALVPVVMVVLLLREDLSWRARLSFALPWIAVGLSAIYVERAGLTMLTQFSISRLLTIFERYPPLGISHYTFNFLGAGVARFVPVLAPVIAIVGTISGAAAFLRARDRQRSLPWLGLMLFALVGALLTALARYRDGGSEQALVARYISFSSIFWIGWLGLFWLVREKMPKRIRMSATAVLAVLALFNSAQLIYEAEHSGIEARGQARMLCTTYPQIDDSALATLHYDGATAARERLDMLHRLNFAPFDDCRK